MASWIAWVIAAVLLAIGEVLTPGLFFLGPVALAAGAAAVTAALSAAVWLQVVVFAAASLASLAFLRPLARRHLTMPAALRRDRAVRPLQPHAHTGPRDRRPVRRPPAPADRPPRAGRLLPAAARHHGGQPRREHRLRHLLPGDRAEVGDLRDRGLHPGD